jgi:predicted glycogen debranching enzyme
MEWLDTNGTGSYASSTILTCHTRKYHGLLVAALNDLPGRYVLLSKFEDSLLAHDREFSLACHRYPGVYFPRGHQYLREFRQDECPHFTFQIGDVRIRRSVMLVQGENTVLVRYAVEQSTIPLTLRLKPLLAFRAFHELRKEDVTLQPRTYPVDNGFKIQPYNGLPALFIQSSLRSMFYPAPVWYRDFEYFVEAERGYEHHEDLFQPGVLEIPLRKDGAVIIAASVQEQPALSVRTWDRERQRRRAEAARAEGVAKRCRRTEVRQWLPPLVQAGRQFLARTPDGQTRIVAGYHWFETWGRDLLIALPGLTFYAGQPELGARILAELSDHEKDGLLPNCFGPRAGQHAYNSVDAALWYFWAVQQMLDHTGDLEAVRVRCWPIMERILRAYMRGTRHGIFMNQDGLIHAGDSRTQLTWMDAVVHGRPVTPRHGYAVEINALWFNAVSFADALAERTAISRFWERDLASRIRTAFSRMFWMPDEGYLADVFSDGHLDTSIRPNQLFAVSLPFSPLDSEQMMRVTDKVRRELLTPFGLRTLSPGNPTYKGRCEGDQASRDSAYHQGTVWPWLLGPFGDACLRVSGNRNATIRFLLENMQPLLHDMAQAGLGHVPEIYDGDPPHVRRGCIAQAWSTGELLRILSVCGSRAPLEKLGLGHPKRTVKARAASQRQQGDES